MARRDFNEDATFQSIRGTAYITGLSMGFIRAGCKTGTIPHIMCGSEYRINMPLFIRQLEAQSLRGVSMIDGPHNAPAK